MTLEGQLTSTTIVRSTTPANFRLSGTHTKDVSLALLAEIRVEGGNESVVGFVRVSINAVPAKDDQGGKDQEDDTGMLQSSGATSKSSPAADDDGDLMSGDSDEGEAPRETDEVNAKRPEAKKGIGMRNAGGAGDGAPEPPLQVSAERVKKKDYGCWAVYWCSGHAPS